MKFSVISQEIIRTDSAKIVAGSENFVEAEFHFDSDWDELLITAYFQNGQVKKSICNVDNDTAITVPWEVLKPGNIYIYLEGYDGNTKVTTAKMHHPITVCKSGKIDNASPSTAPTPNIYEQLLLAYSIATDTAKGVRDDADNGVFNGKSIQYVWDGTSLGIKLEGDEEYTYCNLKGERGASGIFVGPGEMPQDCNIQIDVSGEDQNEEIADAISQYINIESIPYSNENLDATNVKEALDELSQTVTDLSTVEIDSFGKLKTLLRTNKAKYSLSVGDQFTVESDFFGELTWTVIGMDVDAPEDTKYTHSATLMLTSPIRMLEFCPVQLFYCAYEEPLSPGDYYFTFENADYWFHLDSQIDIDGALSFSFGEDDSILNGHVNVFTSACPYADYSVPICPGTRGTKLDQNVTANSIYGNASWRASAVRDYLNSDAYSYIFSTENQYSPRAEWNDCFPGFYSQLTEDMQNAIGTVIKDGESEKVFLLSEEELSQYPFFVTPQQRIMRAYGNVAAWYLRDANGKNIKFVGTDGEIYDTAPQIIKSLTPCCVIY